MNKLLNYVRVSCSTSEDFEVFNVEHNRDIIKSKIKEESKQGVDIHVFPELCLTGYTCGDLFHNKSFLDSCIWELQSIANSMEEADGIAFVGAPFLVRNKLYNCVFGISNGKVLGAVPKTYLPNYNEFYEARWFTSSKELDFDKAEFLGDETIPLGTNILFKSGEVSIAVDVCEDLWVQTPPSTAMCNAGANIVVNCSASNETISKSKYRKDLVKVQSAKCICAYVYCSAGSYESTTDLLFSGHRMIYENGSKLAECIYDDTASVIADIDLDLITNDRMRQTSYESSCKTSVMVVPFHTESDLKASLLRKVNPCPFVPSSQDELNERVNEILAIQSNALAHRFKQTGSKYAIIGVSGGLDSTLALLVTVEAFKKLNKPLNDIICITMPCFGTSKRTKSNADELIKLLGCTYKCIDIHGDVLNHLASIGHCETNGGQQVQDLTFENAQARERTQILMDYANMTGGLVIGTGDLSELALGWCTYNGDHMSMYAVNSSIPKTLVKYLVKGYVDSAVAKFSAEVGNVLLDILNTPISPELLPTDDNDSISQLTEECVGKYDYNDFIMFNLLRNRYSLDKIYYLMKIAFPKESETKLKESICNFVRRFYSQQFKRSCLPDGVKVGSVCLSPRGDWRCPSDISKGTIEDMISIFMENSEMWDNN